MPPCSPSTTFLQARQAVGEGVLAHLDADPAAAHLVSDGGGRAGAEERIEDEVARVGGDMDDALEKPFRFRSGESVLSAKQ